MPICKNGFTVPAPGVVAHFALHLIAINAMLFSIALYSRAALRTNLEFDPSEALLQMLFASLIRVEFVVADKTDGSLTFGTGEDLLLEVLSYCNAETVRPRTVPRQWISPIDYTLLLKMDHLVQDYRVVDKN